ncbi:MAG: molybdenum cofactor guanylyltransferase [Deltaproteobacteria bacterium]|nr:molybdenum cofactor guanylyltransferase [Deltaproteobacteria bacterium]
MASLKHEISCIILAGGENSRIGKDKAFLQCGERTFIEEQVFTLRNIFEEIIIVTNNRNKFKDMNVKVVTDIVPHSGPLGGLYTGLAVSSNIHCFVIGCDMPLINLELIKFMRDNITENDIIIPLTSRGKETLFAIYSINCLETIKQQLELKNLKLIDILKYHKVRYVSEKEIIKFDPEEYSFFNVNSPEDYEKVLRLWTKR